MSRRRRLALRQIAEPEVVAALSDLENERHEDVGVAEPNFNLLGMTMMAQEPSVAAAPPVICIDDDGDADMEHAPTQLVSSPSQKNSDPKPTKKARIGRGVAAAVAVKTSSSDVPTRNTTRPGAAPTATTDIFQLYQSGLCSDHTMRLHYIRRKPPAPPVKPIEHEFVLPRPSLSLLQLLPPQKMNVRDILRDDPRPSTTAAEVPCSIEHVQLTLASATAHWRRLSLAASDVVASWRGLQDYEWQQVFDSCDRFVPAVDDVFRVLETLRSDGFAFFVWRELLVPTVQTVTSEPSTPPAKLPQFITLLLDHSIFRRLPAKDFRQQLRSKNLRAICDASVELVIVTTFHQLRNSDIV